MKIFIDSSALLKKYIHELGSDNLVDLFIKTDEIYVSDLTMIECLSSFHRYFIEKLILVGELQYLCDLLLNDFYDFQKVAIDDTVLETCQAILSKEYLKTLDCLQLGSAILVKSEVDVFVCSDQRLSKKAADFEFNVFDPTTDKLPT